MRCSAMVQEFEKQLKDSKMFESLSFEECVGLLVDAEWNRHQKTKLQKLIKQAALSQPSACIENIEYIQDRKLDKAQMLRFETCKFISDNHHIILKGASGSGKTYIAFGFYHGEEVLKLLGCSKVPADDILLKPELLGI